MTVLTQRRHKTEAITAPESESTRRPTLIETSWDIVRVTVAKDDDNEVVEPILEEVEEMFSLQSQNYFLICAIAEGFVITDLKAPESTANKLLLPRHVRNIRLKLNESNPAVMDLTKTILVAGVRKDFFIWNLRTRDILRFDFVIFFSNVAMHVSSLLSRSFLAHDSRILGLRIMQDKCHNTIISSSLDKKVKVRILAF